LGGVAEFKEREETIEGRVYSRGREISEENEEAARVLKWYVRVE
jgi:hypothetical protein